MREKGEAPLIPGPVRFTIMVLIGLALGFAEHWIRRRFPWPLLSFDWYLLGGIAGGWTLVAGIFSLSVHPSRRMRSQIIWLSVGVLLLAGEWAYAEYEWRPMQRLQSSLRDLAFEEADAWTMPDPQARRAAEGRVDARIAELREAVAESSGQAAAYMRGFLAWKAKRRAAERERIEAVIQIAAVERKGLRGETLYEHRASLNEAIRQLSKASQALMDATQTAVEDLRQSLLEAGVWEWQVERQTGGSALAEAQLRWWRVYQLEGRMADSYGRLLKIVEDVHSKLPPGYTGPVRYPDDVGVWISALQVTAMEHRRILQEVLGVRPPGR